MSASIRRILFLFVLLFSTYSLAENFDCKQAKTDVELAICKYPEIELLNEELSRSYKDLLLSLDPDWQSELINSQKKWLEYLSKNYSNKKASDDSKKWLEQALIWRSKTLLEWKERGNTIFVDKSPIKNSICTNLLKRTNITWMGRNQDSDNFQLEIQDPYVKPKWEKITPYVSYSSFNFFNHKESHDVYKIRVENSHFQYTWYIVPAPGEEDLVKKILLDAGSEQDIAKTAKHFEKANNNGFKSGPFPTANAATWPKTNAATLKTKLFDTSATPLYRGWYTRSHLFFDGQQSYLAAESLNDHEGPTITLFKPLPDGTMTPLCYHHAIPSLEVQVKDQSATSSTCPEKAEKNDLLGADHGCKKRTVILDLAEWGGARPVEEYCFTWGYMTHVNISVGSIGAQTVTENSLWQPISELQNLILDSSQEIFSTTSGHYIRLIFGDEVRDDSPPKGDSYYQIIGNSLKHVCHIGRKVIPPPGYPPFHTRNEQLPLE